MIVHIVSVIAMELRGTIPVLPLGQVNLTGSRKCHWIQGTIMGGDVLFQLQRSLRAVAPFMCAIVVSSSRLSVRFVRNDYDIGNGTRT